MLFPLFYGVRYGEEGASPAVYFQVDTPFFRSYFFPSLLGSNFWELKSVFRLLGARLCSLKTKSCLVFLFQLKTKFFDIFQSNVLLWPVVDRSSVLEYGFPYNMLVEGLRIKVWIRICSCFLRYHADRHVFFQSKHASNPSIFWDTVCNFFKKESSYFILLTGKGTSVFPSFELEWYLDFQSVCILLEAGYYLK